MEHHKRISDDSLSLLGAVRRHKYLLCAPGKVMEGGLEG